MCLPAIRAYKEHFPNDRLTVVGQALPGRHFPEHPRDRRDHPHSRPLVRRAPISPACASCGKSVSTAASCSPIPFPRPCFSAWPGSAPAAATTATGAAGCCRTKSPPGHDRDHHQYYYLKIIEHLAGKKIARAFPRRPGRHRLRKANGRTRWLSEQGNHRRQRPCWPSPRPRPTAAPKPGRPNASAR